MQANLRKPRTRLLSFNLYSGVESGLPFVACRAVGRAASREIALFYGSYGVVRRFVASLTT